MRPISFGTRLGFGVPTHAVRDLAGPGFATTEFEAPPFAVPGPDAGTVAPPAEFVA
jgi:hypothetical protein